MGFLLRISSPGKGGNCTGGPQRMVFIQRSYQAFDIPGIDMLYDSRELNTANRPRVRFISTAGKECSANYGVTGWEFDFRGHKLAGDWQAALGVTVRVHHLTWTSMAGEAKRDYPIHRLSVALV